MLFCLINHSTTLDQIKNCLIFNYNKDNSKKMENKTALITGAAKNIGATIAKKLHNVGMNVIVHYNNSENEAIELIKNLNDIRNNSAIAIQADLEKNEDCSTLINNAINFKKNIDVLVNNASSYYPTPLDQVNEYDWNKLINI